MIGLLVPLFARWGLPAALRRPLALITTALTLLALCGLLWTCWLNKHDDQVIAAHEAEITTEVREATDRAAAEAMAKDLDRLEHNAAQDAANRKAIEHAQMQNPVAAARPAGPAVNAVAERLRARARSDQRPAR